MASELGAKAMSNSKTTPYKSGWLIESIHIDGTAHWWTGDYFDDDWTKDSLKAVAFASKEDAEKIVRIIGWNDLTVTEHQWG